MVYPCIIYDLDKREANHADNIPYRTAKRYQVTVIDRNGLSTIPDAVFNLPMCAFERRFKANSLYHDVFNVYF